QHDRAAPIAGPHRPTTAASSSRRCSTLARCSKKCLLVGPSRHSGSQSAQHRGAAVGRSEKWNRQSVRKVRRVRAKRFLVKSGRDLPRTPARYCRTRATVSEIWRSTSKGWGACPETGTSTMLGKIMIALTAVAVVTVVPMMSASAQQKSTQQKKITVNIPKQVCEMLTVETQNWGPQTVQVCGPSWWTP